MNRDTVNYITRFLPLHDVVNLHCTNKRFREILDSNVFIRFIMELIESEKDPLTCLSMFKMDKRIMHLFYFLLSTKFRERMNPADGLVVSARTGNQILFGLIADTFVDHKFLLDGVLGNLHDLTDSFYWKKLFNIVHFEKTKMDMVLKSGVFANFEKLYKEKNALSLGNIKTIVNELEPEFGAKIIEYVLTDDWLIKYQAKTWFIRELSHAKRTEIAPLIEALLRHVNVQEIDETEVTNSTFRNYIGLPEIRIGNPEKRRRLFE